MPLLLQLDGVQYEFDATLPGAKAELLASAITTDGADTIHIQWNRIPRRSLLVHIYDVLLRGGGAKTIRPSLAGHTPAQRGSCLFWMRWQHGRTFTAPIR